MIGFSLEPASWLGTMGSSLKYLSPLSSASISRRRRPVAWEHIRKESTVNINEIEEEYAGRLKGQSRCRGKISTFRLVTRASYHSITALAVRTCSRSEAIPREEVCRRAPRRAAGRGATSLRAAASMVPPIGLRSR